MNSSARAVPEVALLAIRKLIVENGFVPGDALPGAQFDADAELPGLLSTLGMIHGEHLQLTHSVAPGLLLPNNSKYKEIEDLQAAGDGVTVAVLQNVYAEELVHPAQISCTRWPSRSTRPP